MNPLPSLPDDVKTAAPNGTGHNTPAAPAVGTSTPGATAVPAAPAAPLTAPPAPVVKPAPTFVALLVQCVAAGGSVGAAMGFLLGFGLRAVMADFELLDGLRLAGMYALAFGLVCAAFGLVIALFGGLLNLITGKKR